MITTNLNDLELNEFIGKHDLEQHCKATFPLVGVHGSKQLATVYFEIEPKKCLGRHTDSAEELLIVLQGDAEVQVGNETKQAKTNGLILVPKMEPHNIRNIGKTKLKVLGVFGGANNIVATFDEQWMPADSNVVDTAMIFK